MLIKYRVPGETYREFARRSGMSTLTRKQEKEWKKEDESNMSKGEPRMPKPCNRPPSMFSSELMQSVLIKEPTRKDKIVGMINRCIVMDIEIPQEWIDEYNDSVKEGLY